jgi:phosphoglycolate phosphatase-like HAD superfamily hydrolase
MRRRPLLLLDCDGSLLASEDELASGCFDDALSELSGRLWPPDVFVPLEPGQTVRGAVRALGVDPEAWLQRSLELYFDRFEDDAAAGWRLPKDVEPTLRRLALDGYRLALVSGRPEAIVRFRLERLGIGGYFARGTGAFGCEADSRDDLLRLALWRSACTPRHAVLVTDAPAEVCGLTAVAVRSLAALPAQLSERRAA